MGESDTSTIDVGGSLSTGGGDVAGRDVINNVYNFIEKQMPKSNLPREFKKTLTTLDILIETLKAWKEVHNALDEIRSKFDQFKLPIASASFRRQMISYRSINLYWRPVFGKVVHFEHRIQNMTSVEQRFSQSPIFHKNNTYPNRGNDVAECRKKGFLLIDISKNVENAISHSQPPTNGRFFFENIKLKIGLENFWLSNLSTLNDELDHTITEAMYISDKLLRESAEILYDFSRTYMTVKGK